MKPLTALAAGSGKFLGPGCESIHWYKKWDQVFDTSRAPFYRWFSGALVNTCYNLLDVHVENGRAEQIALIYNSPVTGDRKVVHLS